MRQQRNRANEQHSERQATNPPLLPPAIFCRLKSSILTGEKSADEKEEAKGKNVAGRTRTRIGERMRKMQNRTEGRESLFFSSSSIFVSSNNSRTL